MQHSTMQRTEEYFFKKQFAQANRQPKIYKTM